MLSTENIKVVAHSTIYQDKRYKKTNIRTNTQIGTEIKQARLDIKNSFPAVFEKVSKQEEGEDP